MKVTETPLIRQYEEMKKKHPDAILLFRVGDFYECYKQDALDAIEILNTDYHVHNTDNYGDVPYTRFPHHALDTYLPKIVRAGKRVAICEQLEDPKLTKKTESKTDKTEKNMETKNETKNTIKQINCNLTDEQLRELGEPDAYFSLIIPKECKTWWKQTDEEWRPATHHICIEPGNGKIIVTNTHILHTIDVECDGAWPTDENGMPFQCFIDPKAIRELAGKQTDIAVWRQGRKVTACEASGVLTQNELAGRFPDYMRVIPREEGCSIKINPDELKRLREFVRANMGKTKAECKNRCAVVHAAKNDADTLQVRIIEQDFEKYPDEGASELASEQFELSEYATHYAQAVFNAALFYYAVQEDFNGQMWIPDVARPAKFMGEMRRTILMPVHMDGIEQYVTNDRTAKTEPEPESEKDNEPKPF